MSDTASRTIDEDGVEVDSTLDSSKALVIDQSLAVELSSVEIDRQIATAHKFPRSLDAVVKRIKMFALYSRESAENCMYALPRGGKPIIGPSIGYANILMTSWGNCRVASQMTFVDRPQRLVFAQGGFLDLEVNGQSVIVVSRRISGKNGFIYPDDMIQVTGQAAASIARRNVILTNIPRGIWYPVFEEAVRIVRGDGKTFAENKDAAYKSLAQFGVKPEQILSLLGIKGDIEMTLDHIPMLRAVYQSLRAGSATVEELFDPRKMTGCGGFEPMSNPLASAAAAAATTAAAQGTVPTEGQVEAIDLADEEAEPPGAEAPHPAQSVAQTPTEGGASPAQESTGKPVGASVGPGGTQAPQNDNEAAGVAHVASGATTKKEGAAAVAPEKEQANELPLADPLPAKAAPPAPTTAAEYIVYWREFCRTAQTVVSITNQAAANRNLRQKCSPFTEEQVEEIAQIRTDRVAELKGK